MTRTSSTRCGRSLTAQFGGRLFIAKSLPYFLELASPRVSKGSGMAFLAEHLGFTAAQTVAFGDGENDLELLEWAGYGVCVENGNERLKAQADFVCPGPEEEGVAQVIEALPRLRRMIDLKAARADPDGSAPRWRARARREAFDALLEADERWRALVPRVDELRGATKLKGKPTPEQLEELQSVKEELKAAEEELAAAEAERDEARAARPEPAARRRTRRLARGGRGEIRRVGEPPQLAEPREHTEVGRFEMERAARMSGRALRLLDGRHRAARARALPARARPAGGEGLHHRAPAGARPRGGADRHRLRSRPTSRTSTSSPPTTSTSPALRRSRSGACISASCSRRMRCRSATWASRRASGVKRAPPAATRGG